MSVANDLAALYAEPFLTVPATVGGVATRGFLDDGTATLVDDAGAVGQVRTIALRVRTAALPAVAVDATAIIGAVGAASATGGTSYRVRAVSPDADGLETVLTLARVA